MNSISQFFYPCFCLDARHQRLNDSSVAAFFVATEDNPYSEPAAVAACRTGNLNWLKALIAESGSIVFKDYRSGETENRFPLVSIAVQKGYLEVTDLLISHGADVNRTTDTGTAPLSYAAIQGHTKMAKLLISHGADVNRAADTGTAPLSYAAKRGHTEIAELLICNGADVNRADKTTGATPLCFAANEGHPEVAELLILHGADVNQTDNTGATPLYLAAQNGHAAIVRCLLDAGADPKKKWTILGSLITKSPLSAALINSKNEEIVTLLKTTLKERSQQSADSAKLLLGGQHSSYGAI